MRKPLVVLDAMGVIYSSADDVEELLIPYVRLHGGKGTSGQITDLYREASLGELSSAEFWQRCGLLPSDADYCTGHALMPGLLECLQSLAAAGHDVVSLTNDVSEWSRELRARFGLDAWIHQWVVSGDIGVRKPDPGAYAAVESVTGVPAAEIYFFDDRPANVIEARAAGWQAHQFTSFDEVLRIVQGSR